MKQLIEIMIGFFHSLIEYDTDAMLLKIGIAGIMFIIPLFACILDFWSGVRKAKRRGERIASDKMRRSCSKLVTYWLLITAALLADFLLSVWFDYPYVAIVICLVTVLIETKSMLESAHEKDKDNIVKAIQELAKALPNKEIIQTVADSIMEQKNDDKDGKI